MTTTTATLGYLQSVRSLLAHIEQTQLPSIEKAAELIVASLTSGGSVFCSEIGHGIQGDFLSRAGGMAAVHRFAHTFTVDDGIADALKDRPRPLPVERDLEAVRLAVRSSNLRAGDVVLAGSVSGRGRTAVELAMACREIGVKTVGITSLAYTREVTSAHPTGLKLCDVVDVVIDNGAPYGDAAVQIPGYDCKLLPVSGVSCATIGHMIFGAVMEKMAALGKPATVFISVNREGGMEFYKKAVEEYNQRGY